VPPDGPRGDAQGTNKKIDKLTERVKKLEQAVKKKANK
jgi:hypothetical protein